VTDLPVPAKPAPMVCPQCGKATDWTWDDTPGDEEWVIDGEWWYDPAAPEPRTGYTDSRWCYLRRQRSLT
jgi:hypothetical protein